MQLSLVPTFVGQSFHDAAVYMHDVAQQAPKMKSAETLEALANSDMWVRQGIDDLAADAPPKAAEAAAIGNDVLDGIAKLTASIEAAPKTSTTSATADAIEALATLAESASALVHAPQPHRL